MISQIIDHLQNLVCILPLLSKLFERILYEQIPKIYCQNIRGDFEKNSAFNIHY